MEPELPSALSKCLSGLARSILTASCTVLIKSAGGFTNVCPAWITRMIISPQNHKNIFKGKWVSIRISGDKIPFFAAVDPVDFPVLSVQVPRNANRSHRLNTSLHAMAEQLGTHLIEQQTIKQW
jgi:hypothetical protein